MRVACVLVTHLRAKVEMGRQPHLKDRSALIVDRSQGRAVVIDYFHAAAGVAAGMTVQQALSRQADSPVMEADEAAYRRVFHRMLLSLQEVSDRVEDAGLGTAYVGLDGLEAMYGGEARLVTTLLNAVPQDLAPRVGVGGAKFPAYVAALTSQPMGATRVPLDAAGFLSHQPVDLLPIAHKVREELHRFGLHTLGDLAAMNITALTDRFGREGRRAWELAQGIDDAPLVPLKHDESVSEYTALPIASASLDLLLAATDTLLRKAYAQPRMRGPVCGRGDSGVPPLPGPALAKGLSLQAGRGRLATGIPHHPGPTGRRAPPGPGGGDDPGTVQPHRGVGYSVEPDD